jgi:hypothetical protein
MARENLQYTFDYPNEIELQENGDIIIQCYSSMSDGQIDVVLRQKNLQELLFKLEESVIKEL